MNPPPIETFPGLWARFAVAGLTAIILACFLLHLCGCGPAFTTAAADAGAELALVDAAEEDLADVDLVEPRVDAHDEDLADVELLVDAREEYFADAELDAHDAGVPAPVCCDLGGGDAVPIGAAYDPPCDGAPCADLGDGCLVAREGTFVHGTIEACAIAP